MPRARKVLLRGVAVGSLLLALVLLVDAFKLWPPLGGRVSGARRERVRTSPNWRRGSFVNLVPTHTLLPGTVWKTVYREFVGDEPRVPAGGVPIVRLRREDVSAPPPAGLRATWIGHATVLVEIDGLKVLTDPIWSERCSPFPGLGPKRFHPPPIDLAELGRVDAVVISHDHYDHLDMKTIQALATGGTKFHVPLGIGAHLEKWGVPLAQIVELDWHERASVGAVTIVALPNRHYSGRGVFDGDATQWAAWAMLGPSHRVFYSGDTGPFDGFRDVGASLGPFDLAVVKIGAYGSTWPEIHIDPEQAVTLHEAVRGKLLFPVHWGTFNLSYHDWREPAERLVAAATGRVSFVVPRPGQMITPAAPAPVERWWAGR